ncbi:hypothetical protein EI94DRAFT_1737707 [Lactarius quietus]|nr:hypothetical protein EI94DRAFT_1737707 [Lactarius quietus]
MMVEFCVSICQNQNHIYAGVEDGTDCCKCMSGRSCLHCTLQCRCFVNSTTRSGCRQIVETS